MKNLKDLKSEIGQSSLLSEMEAMCILGGSTSDSQTDNGTCIDNSSCYNNTITCKTNNICNVNSSYCVENDKCSGNNTCDGSYTGNSGGTSDGSPCATHPSNC